MIIVSKPKHFSNNIGSRKCRARRESRRAVNWSESTCTYLENRFRIRPTGVVSWKLIGDLKIATSILSCNLREAYSRATTSVRIKPPFIVGGILTSIALTKNITTLSMRAKPAEPTPNAT